MSYVMEALVEISLILLVGILTSHLWQSIFKSRKSDEARILKALAKYPNGLSGPDLAKSSGVNLNRFYPIAIRLERSKEIDGYFKLEIVRDSKPRLRMYAITSAGRQAIQRQKNGAA